MSSTTPGPRPWGPRPETHRDEDAPPARGAGPSPGSSGPDGYPPITRVYGLLAVGLGLWTLSVRWEGMSRALDARRVTNAARDLMDTVASSAGMSAEALSAQVGASSTVLIPAYVANGAGLIAGALAVLLGAVLLAGWSGFGPLVSRGLLVCAAAFGLAYAADVLGAYLHISAAHDAITAALAQMRSAGGDRSAMAEPAIRAWETMARASVPSLSDAVVRALLRLVPILAFLGWGWHHTSERR